jgi:subtilisin family serine protease
LLVFLVAALSASAGSDAAEAGTYPEELLISFREGTKLPVVEAFFAHKGVRPIRHIPQIDVWLVTGTTREVKAVRDSRAGGELVRWLESNHPVRATQVTPNDNFYLAQQENLRVIGLPEAWTLAQGSSHVPIAIIDTGVDLDHPDLQSKIWTNSSEIPGNDIDDDSNGYIDDVWGWDFVSDDFVPQDDHSHGSHVSGVAAATTNNGIGMAGVAWHAPIMPLKVLDNQGLGSVAAVAEAIVYAADNGARIVNLSLGSLEYSQAIAEAVAYALARGCLLVASAGNDGGVVEYPAALPGVMAVSATDNQDLPWSRSNRGPEVELAAPGVNIFSANRQGGYYLASGTSMAAAHVSGVAALLWALSPSLEAGAVRGVLLDTAQDLWSAGFDPLTGWGRVDAAAAVRSVNRTRIFLPTAFRG